MRSARSALPHDLVIPIGNSGGLVMPLTEDQRSSWIETQARITGLLGKFWDKNVINVPFAELEDKILSPPDVSITHEIKLLYDRFDALNDTDKNGRASTFLAYLAKVRSILIDNQV
ncbi:MAG: hypothetical protein Q9213_004897 [Squamulea squamosa]